MIKAILFDWADTLSPGIPEGYFPIKKIRRKFKLGNEVINQCLLAIQNLKVPFEPRSIGKQKQILTDFYKSLASEIKIKNPDSFVKYSLEWNFDKATPILFPGVLDTLDYLSKKNYDLAVLTNGWPTRSLEIKRSKVGKYFKTILVSAVIGAAKPEIEAYQIAIREMVVSPNKILFVDNAELCLVPAEKLGMKVVLMDRENLCPISTFPRIKDVSEIIGHLNLNNEED